MKQKYIDNLNKANLKHLKFIENMNKYFLYPKKVSMPIKSTDCKFGKIFYDIKFELRKEDKKIINKIEMLHFHIHDEYSKIYNEIYKNKNIFFTKILNQKIKTTKIEKESINNSFNKIYNYSEKLNQKIEEFNKILLK